MVDTVGLLLLAVLAIAVFGAFRIIRAIRPFLVNTVVGLVVLIAAQYLGAQVAITPLALLVVAIGGFPGAILVILLAYVDLAFVPALLVPLL